MNDEAAREEEAPEAFPVDEIVCVRRGPGANCSSVGSALDVLFVTAVAAGAILVAVSAALAEKRPARAAGEPASKPVEGDHEEPG